MRAPKPWRRWWRGLRRRRAEPAFSWSSMRWSWSLSCVSLGSVSTSYRGASPRRSAGSPTPSANSPDSATRPLWSKSERGTSWGVCARPWWCWPRRTPGSGGAAAPRRAATSHRGTGAQDGMVVPGVRRPCAAEPDQRLRGNRSARQRRPNHGRFGGQIQRRHPHGGRRGRRGVKRHFDGGLGDRGTVESIGEIGRQTAQSTRLPAGRSKAEQTDGVIGTGPSPATRSAKSSP